MPPPTPAATTNAVVSPRILRPVESFPTVISFEDRISGAAADLHTLAGHKASANANDGADPAPPRTTAVAASPTL